MSAVFKKVMLSMLMLMTLVLASCENDNWRLENESIGSWSYYYEDAALYEEVTYNFTPSGKWSYLYIYEDIFGRYQSEVDGGYYTISYGRLNLYSNFYGDSFWYEVDIKGNRMYLWDGEYETELYRLR